MLESSDKLYTARQVREQDNCAIHEFSIAGYELMKRAGRAVVNDTVVRYPAARHWLVMCGPGNNGGDGYVVARMAAGAGVDVSVCSLVDTTQLKGDAALALGDWQAAGGKVLPWPLPADVKCDLALDALLGTGIDREVSGGYRQAIDFLNQLDCPTVAIDIPSGLNADTGCVMAVAVRARSTVTFVGRKRGMYTADGPDYCGNISFDDLSIPSACAAAIADSGSLVSADFLDGRLKTRKRNSHKGSYGHVLGVGGIAGMSGAIRLCGEAALRSGAGRVTLATDPVHATLLNPGRPELMVRPIAGVADLLPLLSADHILAAGPGLGSAKWSELLFNACLDADLPLVVDADGLNLLAQRKTTVARENWILTPHPAEAARLLDCKVAAIQQDRVTAAQAIAGRYAACVVLKGCGTVIASPGGEYAICALGNPGMATAGSGDVLTGIIAALLGQGLDYRDAAIAGVVAHAAAGDLAAQAVGETALLATDIIEQLPGVWMAVEKRQGLTR
ncbi:MAG: NAD(P)H-hydrate dehydratase [Gammaproteobacteria bacterium]|nr:MAG: NAD(P)H-hydrate dehydratase [Gammaproteobacteria bacterium]